MSAHDQLTPLEVAIGDWLQAQLPDHTIIAEGQRGPRLEVPFATFQLTEDRALGMSAWTVTNEAREDGHRAREAQTRQLTVNVNVYGPRATTHAHQLRQATQRPPALEAARALGFGVCSASAVRRLSYVEDTRRVGQANLTLRLSAVHTQDHTTQLAAEAVGAGEDDLDGAAVPNPW